IKNLTPAPRCSGPHGRRIHVCGLHRMGTLAPDYSPLEFAQTGIAFEYANDIEDFAAGVAKARSAYEEEP
ncbi:hypothetical protein NKJ51_30500, partial [Mesorhizobium sp. M0134]|uniref:hypothetical protein n=1 Tax=Mesorhizobium sp. M0134 TaxID=2956889 RepID=UPI00333D383A